MEWAVPRQRYDKVLASKVFTFTPDYDYDLLDVGEVVRGGTGYDLSLIHIYCRTLPSRVADLSVWITGF